MYQLYTAFYSLMAIQKFLSFVKYTYGQDYYATVYVYIFPYVNIIYSKYALIKIEYILHLYSRTFV